MFSRSRKAVVIGTAGGIVLGAAAIGGVVFAQTSPGSGPSGQHGAAAQARESQFINDLAANLGIQPTQLQGALKTTADQEVDKAVTAGKLTQAEATSIKAAIDSGKLPAGVGFRGVPGGGMMGVLGQYGQQLQTAVQSGLQQAMPNEPQAQLQSDLRSGKTLDQIATANHTTLATVQADVSASVKAVLDPLVQGGQITAAQEQSILNGITSGHFPFFGFGGRMGGHGPHGAGKNGSSGGTTPTT